MAKLPPIPQAWNVEPSDAPQDMPRPLFDFNKRPEGILGGSQTPDWSLEHSGLSLLLNPQTIAQIDFGDRNDLRPNQPPPPMADRLAQERKQFSPAGLNTNEQASYQIAQAGGPLPYPLRQVPIPRFTPNRIPGYNTERMDADGNVYDHLDEPSEIRGAMQDLAARGRQMRVGKDYEFDKKDLGMPTLVDKNAQFWSAPNAFPLAGWPGNTYRNTEGRYFIDRNGDGAVDVKVYQDHKNNITMIDYGDGAGFRPYDRDKVLPPPYVTPPLISPRRK